ncbi:hypothetical protein F5Y17DRAFT_188294 [Xylariaceae sp. FL0594]|nr:hypothetical protein F5Y17DRAFT_188294 [Xylariaceae sp. FL0594]
MFLAFPLTSVLWKGRRVVRIWMPCFSNDLRFFCRTTCPQSEKSEPYFLDLLSWHDQQCDASLASFSWSGENLVDFAAGSQSVTVLVTVLSPSPTAGLAFFYLSVPATIHSYSILMLLGLSQFFNYYRQKQLCLMKGQYLFYFYCLLCTTVDPCFSTCLLFILILSILNLSRQRSTPLFCPPTQQDLRYRIRKTDLDTTQSTQHITLWQKPDSSS